MEASSSSSSSGTAHNLQEHLAESHVSTPSHKFSPSQSLTIEEVSGPELERRISKQTWYRRFGRAAGFENAKVQKVWQYIRGPRPKRDLAGPTPFLNLTFQAGNKTWNLALEPFWIRITTPFTNPYLFVVLAIGYIIGFAFFARAQSFQTPTDAFIDCTSVYWVANDGCGLNGENCATADDSTFDFRCPAQCNNVILQNPRTIGDGQLDLVPLIVGGGDANGTYRGDTFICAAAVQAGLVSNSVGGCATLQLVSNFTDFLPLTANGLTSIGFPTIFPLAFRFLPETSLSHCEDLRNPALAFNVIITALLFLVLRPKPIVLYWCLVCIGYWHVTLFSQPRASPPPIDQAFESFLPTLFIAYAFWRLGFRFVLPAFRKAPLEASVWYLAPFWFGVLLNITTNWIPIDRLVASDIQRRPGALTAIIILVIVLVIVVVNQVRVIRKTGWLFHYVGWYVAGGLVLLVLSQLPGLTLRLHHYIIPMALIPGTAFPTRLSAIYQGLLLGMFLNGIAAFGLDSILQTAEDLRRDAPLGSSLPTFATNSTSYNSSIPWQNQTIFWDAIPAALAASEGWDGFALLVDDVERYVGTALNYSLAALQEGLPHFFRLAYTNAGQSGDFTMAATLWPNGTWVEPLPGPS